MKAYKIWITLVLGLIGGLYGCMQSFTMSEESIKQYYQQHPPLPILNTLVLPNAQLHYATSKNESEHLLLLIHGAPGAWFGYKEYLHDSSLLAHFKIIVPDRLGYNQSTDTLASVAQQAASLAQLLRRFPHQKVTVLGRSYGAPIAARLAMDYPELVDALVLVAPACAPHLEKFWWFSGPSNTPFARFFLPKYVNRASDEKFMHTAQLQQMQGLWATIRCPVSIVQGGKDWIIDVRNGAYVDSALVNAPHKYVFLPENGHLLTTERPDIIRELILETL